MIPWRYDFTRRTRSPILQGSDFVAVLTFPVLGGIAVDWSTYLVRAQLRDDVADYTATVVATIDCTMVDPVTRTVRFRIPSATTAAIAATGCKGRWDAEIYRFDPEGAETDVMRVVEGRWELSQEVTR